MDHRKGANTQQKKQNQKQEKLEKVQQTVHPYNNVQIYCKI